MRYATALLKARNDVILHGAEDGHILGEHRHVVGGRRTGQARGMLGRQDETLGGWINLDHPRRGHHAEPLAHLALVQPCAGGALLRGRRRQFAQDLEQPCPMADGDHQAQGAMIESHHETPRKGFGLGGIEIITRLR